MTGPACVVCGTEDSGVPKFGMAVCAISGHQATFYACKAHADSVQLVADGYDRSKNPVKLLVRPMRVDEAKALRSGQTVKFIANDGTLRNIKVNGQPQVWVRDQNKVRVPAKYGMYEFVQLYNDWDTGFMQKFVVVIETSQS